MTKPWERRELAHNRKENAAMAAAQEAYLIAHEKPIVRRDHPQAKDKLDGIGATLAHVMALQVRSRALVEELWARYLRGCKVHGVEPVKKEAT